MGAYHGQLVSGRGVVENPTHGIGKFLRNALRIGEAGVQVSSVPLHGERFLAVVAPPGDEIDSHTVHAFVINGRQRGN